MRLGCACCSHSSWPLQTSCRPRDGCGSLGRSEASEWRFAANSPSIAKRNAKEGPLERKRGGARQPMPPETLNQALHKLACVSELATSLLHMMANGSCLASCRPKPRGPKRQGAAELSADRPSLTMTSAFGTPSCKLSEVCGPCVKEGSNLWHSAGTSGITRVMPPENKGLALKFAPTIRVCRGSGDQIES
jgi:hypothetical protein